jgi:multimeric flavodoxin WrbA
VKVLGIVCSPRKGGNTEILTQEALSSARECGAKTELLTSWDKDIKPCDGCFSCENTGKCHIKDDMEELYPKFLEADGMIWATPVYFFNVSAQAKILIDRLYALYAGCRLNSKVGGTISIASSLGHQSVWNTFNVFYSVHHMLQADFVFGFARGKGDIRKDNHAMKAARELGRQIVLLIEQKFIYPEEFDITLYALVKRRYGIDMCPAMGRFD